MSKLTQIRLALSKLLSNFSTEGPLTWTEDGPIEVGFEVYTEDSEGNYIPAEDGEYQLGEKKVVVEAGKVVSIEGEKPVEEELSAIEEPVEEPIEEPVSQEEPAIEETPVEELSAEEEKPVEEVALEGEQMPICDPVEETPDPLAEIKSQVGELAEVVAVLVEKVTAIEQEAALTKETLEKMSKMSVAMSAQIEVEKNAVSGTGNPKLDARLREMFR